MPSAETAIRNLRSVMDTASKDSSFVVVERRNAPRLQGRCIFSNRGLGPDRTVDKVRPGVVQEGRIGHNPARWGWRGRASSPPSSGPGWNAWPDD